MLHGQQKLHLMPCWQKYTFIWVTGRVLLIMLLQLLELRVFPFLLLQITQHGIMVVIGVVVVLVQRLFFRSTVLKVTVRTAFGKLFLICLLYTSDAADE